MWLIPDNPPWTNPSLDKLSEKFDISRERMVKNAENLLQSYRKKHPDSKEKPGLSYLKKIAELRKVNSIIEGDLNASALLKIKNDGFVIVYSNAEKNKGRRNFSIAHEIGHTYFYDINKLPRTIIPIELMKSNGIIERLCDIFAANLLMPKEKMLNQNISKSDFYFETIHKIADTFGTSKESSFYRIAELDLIKHHRDQNFFIVLVRQNRKMPRKFTYSCISATPAKFDIETFSIDNGLFNRKTIKSDEYKWQQAYIKSSDTKYSLPKKVDCKAYFKKYLTMSYSYLIGIYEIDRKSNCQIFENITLKP